MNYQANYDTPQKKDARELIRFYSKLDDQVIQDVIDSQTLVAVVKNFLPNHTLQSMASALEQIHFTGYSTAPRVGKALGEAFYETTGSTSDAVRYFAESQDSITKMRELFSPHLHPIDLLRLCLDEVWMGGAQLLKNRYHQPMFVGLFRGFESGGEALPHADLVKLDDVMNYLEGHPTHQLAANVHLQQAEEGGEVEVFDFKTTVLSVPELQVANSYEIDLQKLPKNMTKATYSPNAGDLVLFDSNRVHAVKAVTRGKRITASCFLWIDNTHSPIRLFS